MHPTHYASIEFRCRNGKRFLLLTSQPPQKGPYRAEIRENKQGQLILDTLEDHDHTEIEQQQHIIEAGQAFLDAVADFTRIVKTTVEQASKKHSELLLKQPQSSEAPNGSATVAIG